VTSQILANIYLNELDQFVKHTLKTRYYIRYCDDFVILHTDKEVLKSLLNEISNFLYEKLKLELHPRKVSFRKLIQGTDFLGYVSLPHYRVVRTHTKRRMLKRLATIATSIGSEEDFMSALPVIRSYLGILSHCKGKRIEREIKRMFDNELWEKYCN